MPDQELALRSPAHPGPMTDAEIDRMYRLAKGLATSGVFKDAVQAGQAFAKMVIGRDLGLSTAQSMQGLYFVKGAVQIAYPMLGSFVRQHPDYDYSVEDHTAEACTIVFYRHGEEEGRSTYTYQEAKAAGLVKPDSAWAKSPRNMVFARAMSNGVKWFCPDVLGGVPVYVEGEIIEQSALTAGQSDDAEPQGIDLPPEVEAILARATELGHVGLSNRATAEMAAGRDAAGVAEWVATATRELDRMDEPEPVDAEVVVQSHQDVRDALAEAAERAVDPPAPADAAQTSYDSDEAWRGRFDSLMHRLGDLEAKRDEVGDQPDILAELDALDGELTKMGVPHGWVPVVAGQGSLEI